MSAFWTIHTSFVLERVLCVAQQHGKEFFSGKEFHNFFLKKNSFDFKKIKLS